MFCISCTSLLLLLLLVFHHWTGPYIVLGTTPEEDVQVGVVSWAVNCASSQFPMVGSRTSASVDFIRD
ncbi:hypothetical protein FRACYDRAFT_194596, partial [Fragilariopsis cylindrus CCMP1102]